ncbi:MAG: ABC transporter ATP-binding protein [Rickettsiales bacterium]|nr:ABC transporter ATP-binding protein [Rickettsiales bacterium]
MHHSAEMIALENVSLSLKGPRGQVDILEHISLTVNRGERVSLMGPSGSGKTSLLMCMAGLERVSGGVIRIDGREVQSLAEDAMAAFRRDTIGIVFQNFHLIPTMTALENVTVPMEFARKGNAKSAAQAALAEVGLSHRMDHFPSQLSGGEQQRVALARAFAMRPKLLLADEPTGNLDQETGKQIVGLMMELHRELGTTLLLITHDKGLAEQCDRIITIRDGKIV